VNALIQYVRDQPDYALFIVVIGLVLAGVIRAARGEGDGL
jgi:hypothetical protein